MNLSSYVAIQNIMSIQASICIYSIMHDLIYLHLFFIIRPCGTYSIEEFDVCQRLVTLKCPHYPSAAKKP